MNDDLTTLASAYLDDATTPDERAQVDGDPAALAEVERLRQVRAVLAQSESAPISTRERHLAAALDVWDRLPTRELTGDATPVGADSAAAAGKAAITAPISLGDRRKQRWNSRILTMAAALVIVVGGGIVARSLISTNDDNSNVASEPVAADEDVSARAQLELNAADETFGDAGESAPQLEAADVPAAPSVGVLGSGDSEAPPDEDLEVLSSDAEVAVFANDLNRTAVQPAEEPGAETASADAAADAPADAAETAADDSSTSFSTLPASLPLCDLVSRIVGPALWEAPGLFNEFIIVGIDDATGEAVAYRPEDCSVVARTSLES